jgi:Fur family transcriptional regulator, ferric uptake regulator
MTRKTEQRAAIRKVFAQDPRPLSVQEILDHAQTQVPGLGIATVYRNVKALVEERWLTTVEMPGQPSRYERAELDHHHHFQCEACDRVFDIPGCAHLHDHNTPAGFIVSRHEVMLYGLCPDCDQRGATIKEHTHHHEHTA